MKNAQSRVFVIKTKAHTITHLHWSIEVQLDAARFDIACKHT